MQDAHGDVAAAAAVEVQRVWRGMQTRQEIRYLLQQRDALDYTEFSRFKRATLAAIQIQCAWRGYVARSLLKQWRTLQNPQLHGAPARGIQREPRWRATVRARVANSEEARIWATWNAAATAIAAVWRGHVARRRVAGMRRHHALTSEERLYLAAKDLEMQQFFNRQSLEEEERKDFGQFMILKLHRDKWEYNRRLVMEGAATLEKLEAGTRSHLEADVSIERLFAEQGGVRDGLDALERSRRRLLLADSDDERAMLRLRGAIRREQMEAFLLDDAVFRQEVALHEMVERDIVVGKFWRDGAALTGQRLMQTCLAERARVEEEATGELCGMQSRAAEWRRVYAEDPRKAADMQHRMGVEDAEKTARDAATADEAGQWRALRREADGEFVAVQRLTLEHEEEEERGYRIAAAEANGRARITAAAQEGMLALGLVVRVGQDGQEVEALLSREARARRELEVGHKGELSGLWGSAVAERSMRLHWALEEEEAVVRQIVRAEEGLAWRSMGHMLGIVLWQARLQLQEEEGRRAVIVARARAAAELQVVFHNGLRQVDEAVRHRRREATAKLKSERDAEVMRAKELSDWRFWEMRQRCAHRGPRARCSGVLWALSREERPFGAWCVRNSVNPRNVVDHRAPCPRPAIAELPPTPPSP